MSKIRYLPIALILVSLSLFATETARSSPVGGTIDTFAGGGAGDGGPATNATLNQPTAVAVNTAGDLYVLDSKRCRIRKVSASVITSAVGTGVCAFSPDGSPALSSPAAPNALALGPDGSVYFTEYQYREGNCRIRRVVAGLLTTVAGNSLCSLTVDGAAATATSLYYPTMLTVDGSGVVYVAGTPSDCAVWKIADNVITRFAGTGTCSINAETNPLAATITPYSIAVDPSGASLYIAENDFFSACRIRKVSGGTISFIAGVGLCGSATDGTPLTSARISPLGMAVGNTGDLFFAEGCEVRRISGSVLTTAASCLPSASGSPPSGTTLSATTLAVRGSGELWMGERTLCRVSKVEGSAIVVVAGGNPGRGFSDLCTFGGDGQPRVRQPL